MNNKLAIYIRELIAENKLYKFYKSKQWIKLKNRIIKDFHNECYLCKQNGKISKAVTVHHVNEVKHRPELALSEYYFDKNGIKHRNLIPLCFDCHNKVHKRFGYIEHETKQITEERW